MAASLEELARTRHWVLLASAPHRLVYLLRTPAPIHDLADLDRSFDVITAAMPAVPRRAPWSAIVDSRAAPVMRNDTAFEERITARRRALVRDFGRLIVVVSTAVGKLQVQRQAREDDAVVTVVASPEEAFAVLGVTGALDPPRA